MHRYLLGLRVERVCLDLRRTDRPIKQLAYDAGFRDPGQLARVFHRQVGVTPTAYRRVFGREGATPSRVLPNDV
jgi:AraC-like DNA-binding protein